MRYIILKMPITLKDKLFCLSANIMQWVDDVWILDMKFYWSYWERQSQLYNVELYTLIQDVLSRTLDKHSKSQQTRGSLIALGMTHDYYVQAVCSNNPWKGILLLEFMERNSIYGFIPEGSIQFLELYYKISWTIYFNSIVKFVLYVEKNKLSSYKTKNIRRKLRQYQKAVQRYDFKTPFDMMILNYQGMRKRYGAFIADIWSWTVSEETVTKALPFPWKSWRNEKDILVHRYLDFNEWAWDYVSSFFQEDIDKIINSIDYVELIEVTKISWRLVLEDQTILNVPIVFRNPIYLKDGIEFILLQASFSYDRFVKSYFDERLSEGCYVCPIIAWQIKLADYLITPPMVLNFMQSNNEDELNIEKLENELDVEMKRYSFSEDWSPRDSYLNYNKNVVQDQTNFLNSLQFLSQNRPLFFLKEQLIIAEDQIKTKQFLDSTMQKWWQSKNGKEELNFYKVTTRANQVYWAIRSGGDWVGLGVF